MIRLSAKPRDNWKKRCEDRGFIWHRTQPERSATPIPYWDESVYYKFKMSEIDAIEAATNTLHGMCIKAAECVIRGRKYKDFFIPEDMIPVIEQSWESEPPSLYGRFDLAMDPSGGIKMLEYNADTPTSLLEAAVIQWDWFEDTKLGSDQFNSIHDKLVATWRYFEDWIPGKRIHFTSVDSLEDGFTTAYLQETASQAGYSTESFPIPEMGWDGSEYVSGNSTERMKALFKLYPWEWLINEPFGKYLTKSQMVWIEPAWKMLLSNKAILPVLWKLFPYHPNLLETTTTEPLIKSGWVSKPFLGREGGNVTVYDRNATSGGEYGEEGFVYQRDANLSITRAEGGEAFPVIGSWIVGQESCGIGIRESYTPIIDNFSRFVPHVIE